MTVKELIAKLREMPDQDTRVVVSTWADDNTHTDVERVHEDDHGCVIVDGRY